MRVGLRESGSRPIDRNVAKWCDLVKEIEVSENTGRGRRSLFYRHR